MKIIHKGERIDYKYETLSPELDDTFDRFYSLSFDNNLDIALIDKKFLPQLEESALKHIKNHNDFETTRKYFKNLRLLWVILVNDGRLQDAEWYLERIVRPINLFEQRTGHRIHKGPVYYFWGGTALLMGEIDKGFLLMHAAYEEEIRINEPQPTPSFKFISLNFNDEKQYFGFLVKGYAEYLSNRFNAYRLAKVSHFGLEDFQKKISGNKSKS